MDNENQEEQVIVEAPEDEDNQPQYNQEEIEALDEGWSPKEKWKGPEDEWVPAKAFLKYGKLESELKRTRSDSSQKEKLIKTMKDYYLNVKDDAKKELVDTFKRQKKEALKNEDYQEVAKLDQQIDDLNENLDKRFKQRDEQIKQIEQTTPVTPPPEFYEWNKRNKWYEYGANSGLSKEADILAVSYARMNPGAQYNDVLEFVENTIKASHPDKFSKENPARERPSDVADGSELSGDQSKRSKIVRLSPEEKAAADAFGLSHEDYAKGLKEWDTRKGAR